MMAASNARKTTNTNGVSQQENNAQTETPKTGKAKAPLTGKKIVIRRLPPGMTAEEAWNVLGEEWKNGHGKVDWSQFQTGSISHDPSFPSQPGRCYLHLVKTDDLPSLSEIVQKSTWEDAKRTMTDSALVGPPYVEIAQFQKIPTAKRRTDPRQGTIDQDPEFQAFLQSLTQPTPTKEQENEQTSEDVAAEDTKVTTTPLVQYLKEKKANKAKEAANAKSAKHTRQESQSGKSKSTTEDSKKKGKESKNERSERQSDKEKEKDKDKDKPKEPVKLLTKKAATQEGGEAAKAVAAQATPSKPAEESAAPKSRRAGIAAAAKILQRDLGLSPGSAHRRARQDAAKAEAAAKSDTGKDSKENKEPVPTASVSETSTSSARPSTPTTAKAPAAEGSRRSRNKTGKQNPPKEDARGKASETSTAAAKSSAQPQPTPVILKRKDKEPSSTTAPTTAATTSAASTSTPTPTGPKAASGKSASSKQGASTSQKKSSSQTAVTAGATRAFLKHVNTSQGVTEALLKQAMQTFGTVTLVEIEKRKGFAYVDFADHESLVKAIAASPITVAQGNIQILERKEIKKAAPASSQPAADKEKAGTETQTPAAAPAQSQTSTERPKRGGRGRGRKGGGDKNKDTATGDATASSSKATPASSAETPAAAAPS